MGSSKWLRNVTTLGFNSKFVRIFGDKKRTKVHFWSVRKKPNVDSFMRIQINTFWIKVWRRDMWYLVRLLFFPPMVPTMEPCLVHLAPGSNQILSPSKGPRIGSHQQWPQQQKDQTTTRSYQQNESSSTTTTTIVGRNGCSHIACHQFWSQFGRGFESLFN